MLMRASALYIQTNTLHMLQFHFHSLGKPTASISSLKSCTSLELVLKVTRVCSQSWFIFGCDLKKKKKTNSDVVTMLLHILPPSASVVQWWKLPHPPPPPPSSPYGHSEPRQPLQAFTALESNWAECVGINYPIIQRRHAIKGAAAITRCRRRLSHVTVTQRGRRLPFFLFRSGRTRRMGRTSTR